MNSRHTIEALCIRSDEVARKSGWVDDRNPAPYAIITALFHSELSEALEDYRNNKLVTEVWYECRGMAFGKDERDRSKEPPGDDPSYWKPCGVPSELADVCIRICQHVGTAGLSKKLQHAANSPEVMNHGTHPFVFANFGELLAEVHLSISRAYLACTRSPHTSNYLVDLAIALRQVVAFCDASGIDLWAAIDEKEAYNRTRSFRHGGKKV